MQIAEHLELLRTEGDRLADVAADARFDALVPGCPGWAIEDVLRHLGDVHRWATTVVGERRTERVRAEFPGPAGRDELIDWFRAGHHDLLRTLALASPAEQFWAWGPAPSPLAFWARRQAHETAIHRVDVEQAAGLPPMFNNPGASADGVDEWLALASRSRRYPVADGGGRRLRLRATDIAAAWSVRLSAEGVQPADASDAADCTVEATAAALFEVVMNRRGAEGVDLRGDAGVLLAWRQAVTF